MNKNNNNNNNNNNNDDVFPAPLFVQMLLCWWFYNYTMTAENPVSSSIILLIMPLVNICHSHSTLTFVTVTSLSLDAVTLMVWKQWQMNPLSPRTTRPRWKSERTKPGKLIIFLYFCYLIYKMSKGEKKVEFDDVTFYPDVCSCCNLMMFYGWCERVVM